MKKKIAFLLITALLTATHPVFATDTGKIKNQVEENKDKIDVLEQEKNNVEQNKKTLNSELAAIIKRIQTTSKEITSLTSTIQTKENHISKKIQDIQVMVTRIGELEQEIDRQKAEITLQEQELKKQEDLLAARVRAAYKSNSVANIIFTLIESKSIVDFTERLLFIERMAMKDQEIMALIDDIIEDLETKKGLLEKDQLEAKETQVTLEKEKIQLEKEKMELVGEKEKLEREIQNQRNLENEKKNLIDNLSEEERRIASEIGDIMDENEALEAEIQRIILEAQEKARREEEERKKAEEESKGNSGTPSDNPAQSQGFVKPVNGRLTSPYGYRTHPIYGDRRFHTGVDYGAAHGAGVFSTKTGTVIRVSYDSGYGNYIIVDHGKGISSLYAHLSGFAVRNGQKVEQGQTIGYVGSTGASTGPHLHFEIRLNGSHRDPMDYLN